MRERRNGDGASVAGGMTIAGRLRARVLGLHLLDVDLDVDVQPSRKRAGLGTRPPAVLPARAIGSIGSGLDSAMRELEATRGDLDEARREMP